MLKPLKKKRSTPQVVEKPEESKVEEQTDGTPGIDWGQVQVGAHCSLNLFAADGKDPSARWIGIEAKVSADLSELPIDQRKVAMGDLQRRLFKQCKEAVEAAADEFVQADPHWRR